ncbi:hypothetical protein JOC54_002822 [Alkalihalobacillus xiaoxiensis]|uniref:GerA spore germination protein n=1 Tax=Shouchella xiaoxiensis TaxID=766895 RepID=A0ABS2SVL4_9BACI|nr:spore germination protein [Shouchella xiaoxiensis]MBM7839542.1 hypothetical protein [Shouchella xiaoxiensis]
MTPFFKKKKQVVADAEVLFAPATIAEVLQHAQQSADFVTHQEENKSGQLMTVCYFQSMVDMQKIPLSVLEPVRKLEEFTLEQLLLHVRSSEIKRCDDAIAIDQALLRGNVLLHFKERNKDVHILVDLSYQEDREITVPEIEFSVFGSKEAFIETVEVNINLLRRRIPTSDLYLKKYIVGSSSKTAVYVVYCQSIANEENVQTVKQRLADLQIDQVPDASTLLQTIEDRSSVFPQIIDTERPDRTAAALMEGKVAILTDGSPQALLAPVTIFEFISAFEDYFLSWQTASLLRIIRIAAVLFSIFATPLYVAVLTYHPEIIPQDLFANLIVSRTAVPFPPIIEALFLEVTIELLREAGARLPTKVGQTIGIVGGIVIGTAAVEAGLTSNVLLIIVALAALASFTIPVYRMGTTIRIVRFPFIIAAQVWGLIAIALFSIFIITHMLSLTSLGRPYMEPIYPFSLKDMKDSLIRLPVALQNVRPTFLQTKQAVRFKDQKKKRTNQMPDIDEGY